VLVGASNANIIESIRLRLDEDETPNTMDESLDLEADIQENIPQNMSEMYVGAMILGTPLHAMG